MQRNPWSTTEGEGDSSISTGILVAIRFRCGQDKIHPAALSILMMHQIKDIAVFISCFPPTKKYIGQMCSS
jgi:hypothetical protein